MSRFELLALIGAGGGAGCFGLGYLAGRLAVAAWRRRALRRSAVAWAERAMREGQ